MRPIRSPQAVTSTSPNKILNAPSSRGRFYFGRFENFLNTFLEFLNLFGLDRRCCCYFALAAFSILKLRHAKSQQGASINAYDKPTITQLPQDISQAVRLFSGRARLCGPIERQIGMV